MNMKAKNDKNILVPFYVHERYKNSFWGFALIYLYLKIINSGENKINGIKIIIIKI